MLAVSAVAGWTGVICVGDDGRIALEAVCLPCCEDGEKVCALTSPDEEGGEHVNCVDCKDLPLDGPTWLHQNRSSHSQFSRTIWLNPVNIAQVVPLAILDEAAPTGRDSTPTPVSLAAILSSTILIC